jgi:2-keto-4-pentenoate hydratase/2-oxohepta-3-ene-1,7-dioic acid hydratase in catechol pathway
VRYVHLLDAAAPLAAVVDKRVVPLGEALAPIATLDELVAAGPDAWDAAERLARDVPALATPPADVVLGAPLRHPSKIPCVGLNYHDHCRETGMDAPARPMIFAKFPSCIVGPDAPVTWSPELTSQVDWEAELAVVIGRRLREVTAAEALAGVFGYTAANDLSARDIQFGDGQWVRGKSLEGFCPLGPAVVTPDEFGDPQRKLLHSRVNGRLMQDSTTAEMIFGVAEILSFLSASFTLEPGDLILTGTPWGVGGFRDPPVFLAPGDVVEVEVEDIGVLRTPIAPHQ